MFERFTDRARRVVVLAQEESRLLNHNYIGTEHLLLGLIHEGEGVAAQVFASLGISLETVRREVEEIIGPGGQAPAGHIPFTPRSKKVLELSLREAMQLGHTYIGTEHILLGLIREGNGVAAQVLVKLGADLSRVRQAVIQELGGDEGVPVRQTGLESRPPRPDTIRPARCAFCNTPSPECGTLYTGFSAALICEHCVTSVAPSPSSAPPSEASTWRSRIQGMVGSRLSASTQRTEYPDRLDVLESFHHSVGPPPDDEDAARRAIEYAFTDPMELSADGTALVNVEDGAALRQYADLLSPRVQSFIAERENVIERIKFIDATRAAVWTTTRLRHGDPPPVKIYQEGWAVLVDGRWKVSRETIRDRWAQVGVTVPPPAPRGQDG